MVLQSAGLNHDRRQHLSGLPQVLDLALERMAFLKAFFHQSTASENWEMFVLKARRKYLYTYCYSIHAFT